MTKLVIYDSLYGNTEKVAKAIAKSISAKAIRFSEIKNLDLKNLDLLVVGSPTQGGRATVALNHFLAEIPQNILKNVKVAVFDTRVSENDLNFALKLLVKTIGYAAPKMAKTLESKGGKFIVPPCGFLVKGKEGPLMANELEKASNWLKNLDILG